MGREHSERLAKDTKLYVGKDTVVSYCPTGWLQFKKNAAVHFKRARGGNVEYFYHEGMVSAQGDIYVNFP